MKLYDEKGNKVKIKQGRSIYNGRNSKLYKVSEEDLLKVWKKKPEIWTEEIMKLLMELYLSNFYQIKKLYYTKDTTTLKAMRMKNYQTRENPDILTESTYYTLENLWSILENATTLTEHDVWINDLHTDNVILEEQKIIIIDTELYTKNRFFTKEDLFQKNIDSVMELFFRLFQEALEKYHGNYNTKENLYLLRELFKNQENSSIERPFKKLSRYPKPIDYFKHK